MIIRYRLLKRGVVPLFRIQQYYRTVFTKLVNSVEEKVGGYTGLYYFFSMSANIIAPPLAGLFIDKVSYDTLLILSCVFFGLALITLQFVKRGDVKIKIAQ